MIKTIQVTLNGNTFYYTRSTDNKLIYQIDFPETLYMDAFDNDDIEYAESDVEIQENGETEPQTDSN